MLTLQLYTLFLVPFVHRTASVTRQPYGALMCKDLGHRTASVTRQPYGALMCKDLGQSLTNTTCLVKYDPLHLSCRIAVPVPKKQIFQMRCVMCTDMSEMNLKHQQICQTVSDNNTCTFITNSRACVFTMKSPAIDTWNFDAEEVTLWNNSESIGMFCAPGLDVTIAENQMNEGDSIRADKCKKGRDAVSMNVGILRERGNCVTSILRDLTYGNWVSVRSLLHMKNESINCKVVSGNTPLIHSLGHRDIFNKLVGLGADLSMTAANGWSVLHLACFYSIPTLYEVKKLVELGLDIEQRTHSNGGRTPHQISVSNHKIEVTKYLISVGCKVD